MHLLLGYSQRSLTVLNQIYKVRYVLLFSQKKMPVSFLTAWHYNF